MFRFFVVFSWWPDTRAACPAGAKADTESCTAGHNGSSRHSQTGLELELGLAAWHMSNCLSPSAVESKQDHSKIVTLNFRPLPRSFTETGWVGCMAHCLSPSTVGSDQEHYLELYAPSKKFYLDRVSFGAWHILYPLLWRDLLWTIPKTLPWIISPFQEVLPGQGELGAWHTSIPTHCLIWSGPFQEFYLAL